MRRRTFRSQTCETLLDFAFFELDVFASNRVIFLHHHFLGDVARILLRHVEKACACSRVEANLDGWRLSHNVIPIVWELNSNAPNEVPRGASQASDCRPCENQYAVSMESVVNRVFPAHFTVAEAT